MTVWWNLLELYNWAFVGCDEITKRHFNASIYATWWKNMETTWQFANKKASKKVQHAQIKIL